MTTEQINKAAEEYARQFPPHLQKFAEVDYIRGANFAIQEIEELKAVIKQQEEEYILNGSVQEWKDYAERTTSIINNLKDENENLREHLELIRLSNEGKVDSPF